MAARTAAPLMPELQLPIADARAKPPPAFHRGERAPRLTPIGELLREPNEVTPYLVDGLLPAGGLSLLLGKPKAGKSTLARCLCTAVAIGGTWLARQCDAGPVVYISLEEKRAEVRSHFRKQFAALKIEQDQPIHVWVDRLPEHCNPVEWLVAAVGDINPALIVIDPLGRFVNIRDGGNDYMDATRQLQPLISYARDSRAQTHVALVHHARKAAGDHGDESLGSTAILGSVDTAISLQRDKGASHRMIYSVNRYGTDLEKSIATLDDDTGQVSLGMTKREVAARSVDDAILDLVANHDEPVEHKAIVKEVMGSSHAIVSALRQLADSGRLTREGAARRGDPHRYSIPRSVPI